MLGKTHLGAYEMACHLTGEYPDWWEGYRVDDSGHTFVCIGITLDSTKEILQKKLFGTEDARDVELMGTGMIPQHTIGHVEKDGGRIIYAQIQHIDGGYNTVRFHCAQDEKKIMGKTLKGVWIDETDKTQCMNIYSQCVVRVTTTEGFVYQTFTPENGRWPL